MKTLLSILLILTSLSLGQSRSSTTATNNKQLIYEEQIKSAGIINLSNIILLSDRINFSTIDGNQNYISVNQMSSFFRQGFSLFIDGQKFENNIFDMNDINLLPISIEQIDSVEIIYSPQLYYGTFADKGIIHFHTKSPEKGFSVNASYIVANETGDPGPYQFTDYSTPNVDKLNFINTATLMSAGENWSLKGNFKLEENFVTDPAIRKRITTLSSGSNKSHLKSGSFQLMFNLLNKPQQIFVGYSTQNTFFHFKPYGNEIPVNRIVSHTGFSGGFDLSNKIELNYSLIMSKNDLGESVNNKDLKFDFGLNNYYGNIEGVYNSSLLNWSVGLTYNEYIGKSTTELTSAQMLFTEFYSSLNYLITENFNQSFGFMLKKLNNDVSLKAEFGSNWQLNYRQNLEFNFAFANSMFEEDLNFWSWVMRGYRSNIVELINFYEVGKKENSNKFSIDLTYNYIYNDFKFEAGSSFRTDSDIYSDEQLFQYDKNNSSLYSPVRLNYNTRASYLSLNAGVEFLLFERFKNKIFYNFSRVLNSTNGSSNYSEVQPLHNISYSIMFKPVDSFGIWARVRYISSTVWTEYKYIDIQSAEKYSYKIDPKLLLDLSIEKWFWNKKIWTNLLFRNIANNVERYHPIGTSLDLRFVFQLHLYFNSLFE